MSTNQAKLQYLAGLISSCQKCPLFKAATHPVPGHGNPNADVVLVGEAPGYFEDQQGLPFVGNSGKLLNKLLDSIRLSRDEVFVANIIKHRPPNNRSPLPSEILSCAPYLKAQLSVIKPKYIITLGRFALNYFFPADSISRVHGQVKNIDQIGQKLTIIPVYHPSAGLRNGSMLKALQQDFLSIGKLLGKI